MIDIPGSRTAILKARYRALLVGAKSTCFTRASNRCGQAKVFQHVYAGRYHTTALAYQEVGNQ